VAFVIEMQDIAFCSHSTFASYFIDFFVLRLVVVGLVGLIVTDFWTELNWIAVQLQDIRPTDLYDYSTVLLPQRIMSDRPTVILSHQ